MLLEAFPSGRQPQLPQITAGGTEGGNRGPNLEVSKKDFHSEIFFYDGKSRVGRKMGQRLHHRVKNF